MRLASTRRPNLVPTPTDLARAAGRALVLSAWLLAGTSPAAASSTGDPVAAGASRRPEPRTVLQCETRRELRAIDRLHFVVEPVARCGVALGHVADRVVARRMADRLPARAGRGRSIHQPAESAQIDPERAVRWSPDRSRLSNVQGERNRRALNGRIVRR